MSVAYIGIGTNMGDRADNIKTALESVELLPETKVTELSNIYETAPWGYLEQDDFLNAVAKVETNLSSYAFLGALLGIEAAMGRLRTVKNGPRVIDLDLLFFEDEVQNTNELTLPHPRIMERAFVLVPLYDVLKNTEISAALEKVDTSGVKLYKK